MPPFGPEIMEIFADVALPIPLPDPLTYSVPPAWASQAVLGVRTRVLMGRRRMTGVIVAVHDRRPEGMTIRPIVEILDREPVLTADLLALARFIADYYMAPLGEVVRTMLPSDLPPLGDRKVWLTDAGAMALPRDLQETAVVDALREGGADERRRAPGPLRPGGPGGPRRSARPARRGGGASAARPIAPARPATSTPSSWRRGTSPPTSKPPAARPPGAPSSTISPPSAGRPPWRRWGPP